MTTPKRIAWILFFISLASICFNNNPLQIKWRRWLTLQLLWLVFVWTVTAPVLLHTFFSASFFCRRMPCILFIISKSRMCEKESQLDEYSLKMTHHDIKAAFITSAELCKEREFETRLTVWPWLPLIYFLVPYIDFSQNSSR